MSAPERLAPGQVFVADGHLSDAAVSAIADLELDLVPREALEHADGCAACGQRIADVTQLSLALDELVPGEVAKHAAALDAAPLSVPAPRGWLAAIAAGLTVALLASLPTLISLPRDPSDWRGAAAALPGLWRVGYRTFAEIDRGALGAVSLAAAATVLIAGLFIARLAPTFSNGAHRG